MSHWASKMILWVFFALYSSVSDLDDIYVVCMISIFTSGVVLLWKDGGTLVEHVFISFSGYANLVNWMFCFSLKVPKSRWHYHLVELQQNSSRRNDLKTCNIQGSWLEHILTGLTYICMYAWEVGNLTFSLKMQSNLFCAKLMRLTQWSGD